MAQASRDQNNVPTLLAASNADGITPVRVYADPTTHRLLVSIPGGSGTVTSVSVVTANGFAGSVADPTTTPAITISTTVTGITKGNGTALSAAVANTDYQVPISLTTTGTSGAATFDGTTLNIPQYSGGASGITIGTTTITSGTTTRVLYDNAGVVGEYVITGTGNVVMSNTPTLVSPILGTPTSGTLTNCTGFPIAQLAGAGTGVLSALAINVGSAGAVVLFNGALGTPSSGTLTNCTGLPVGSITGLGTGVATALAINVGSAGAFVTFNGALGTPSSGTVTNLTGTASININGTVGATTPTTGVFTTLVAGSTTSLLLGTAGSAVGNIGFRNATSGTITLAPVTGALGTVTLSLPAATDQLVGRATTDTLTNKRPQPRTASSTTASTLTPDLSSANVYYRTTQTATLTINAPTGTPVIGEVITIYVDSAGAQTLTIDSTYKVFGAAFPAATTAGKTFMMQAQYNGTDWKTTWANAV